MGGIVFVSLSAAQVGLCALVAPILLLVERAHPEGECALTAISPDPSVAVHMHRLAVALAAVRKAKAAAKEAGHEPADLIRALDLLASTPERVLEREERLARILVAVQAPGLSVEQVDVVERIHDESPRARKHRIRQEGYVAALLGETDFPSWLKTEADRELFAAGMAAFATDLIRHS